MPFRVEPVHQPLSLRVLATRGGLREAANVPGEAARLRSEAFEVALPLVWQRHTRPLEVRKGHGRCASGVRRLAPDCADGFTDDLESVVTALLTYARPISNLEGWITVRMANAIKDGHRVRRAREMGAQQRVRVPRRLAMRLGSDPWLVALADRVLQWAGVRYTAGAGLWPLGAWAEDRAAIAGPAARTPGAETVADDLAVVLAAMKECDAAWYEKYVERPLGRKWAPVATENWLGEGATAGEVAYLDLVPGHERDDARLAEAASACLELMRHGLADGGEPRQVVADALTASFVSEDSLSDEFAGIDPGDVVMAVLAHPAALDRLVGEVVDIVGAAVRSPC
ncbi:MAG: hypothetical protein JWM19_1676 [Actinomycetia bacterium]|nr:hypothetical protein [Actinomycetes bacterium]